MDIRAARSWIGRHKHIAREVRTFPGRVLKRKTGAPDARHGAQVSVLHILSREGPVVQRRHSRAGVMLVVVCVLTVVVGSGVASAAEGGSPGHAHSSHGDGPVMAAGRLDPAGGGVARPVLDVLPVVPRSAARTVPRLLLLLGVYFIVQRVIGHGLGHLPMVGHGTNGLPDDH